MDKKTKKFIGALAETVQAGEVSGIEAQSRRVWIQNFGLVAASSAVLWNCGKKSDNAATAAPATPANDAIQYAAAMALENDAISTYLAAATLPNIKTPNAGNLNGAVLSIAGGFLAQHIAHAGLLAAAIKGLQTANPDAGIPDPVAIASTAATNIPAALVALLTDPTKGVVNVLRLAAAKELNAAQEYVAMVKNFSNVTNASLNADIGADEAGHYGVLRAALFALFHDLDPTLSAATIMGAATISTTPAGAVPA